MLIKQSHHTDCTATLTSAIRVMQSTSDREASQSKAPSGEQCTSDGAASGRTVGCRICNKTVKQTQFSNSQKKRLKKGLTAMCKACGASAGNSGVNSSVSAAAQRAKPAAKPDQFTAPRLQKGCEPIWNSPGFLLPKENVSVHAV